MALRKKHKVIAKANQLIVYSRQKNYLIIFVKVGFSDEYAELAHQFFMLS